MEMTTLKLDPLGRTTDPMLPSSYTMRPANRLPACRAIDPPAHLLEYLMLLIVQFPLLLLHPSIFGSPSVTQSPHMVI